MKQEYNRAMDQVKLPPEAGARILRTLEERAQAPRRRRRRGPLIAALAAAAALLTGAAAAAGLSPVLEHYFSDTPEAELSLLGAGAVPLNISQSYEGWTVTLTDCVGDDHNIYIGVQVEAPEGTALELPDHSVNGGFSFERYLFDLEDPHGTYGWTLAQREDPDPSDNRLWYVLEANIVDPFQRQATIELSDFYDFWYWPPEVSGSWQRQERSETTRAVQGHTFRFEDVPLDYADRTIRLSPNQEVRLLDGTATLTSVEISPITVGARVEGGACVRHHEAVPFDGSCDSLLSITLHMRDGTQLQAGKAGVGGGCSEDPEDASTPFGAFIANTYYYSGMGEPARFIDPAQVEAVEVCGAVIPVAGA